MQKIHLKSPNNWINDPNGFIYYNGEYHLFYQHFPCDTCWGTMHWGHATSRNLVNWEHHGIALFPTRKEDQNGCFSGSAIVSDGKLYLAYTGVRYETPNPGNIHKALNDKLVSAQMMISSKDGYHFDNWEGKEIIIPPISDPSIGDKGHTRDPKIWRGKDAWYIILGSTEQEKQGEVLFYRSNNLKKWNYVNKAKIVSPDGWMCECPDYFQVPGGEVLLASMMDMQLPSGKRGQYALCYPVNFEEKSCNMQISENYSFIDYGLDLYAPQTTVDKEGRRVMMAWIRMPEPVDEKWIGMFSSPRVVEMQNGHIYFRLHPEIRQAFSEEIRTVSKDGNKTWIVPETGDGGYMIDLEMHEGERLDLGGLKIYRQDECIHVDRNKVYPDDGENSHFISVTPKVKEGNHLEILVDGNLVEIYVNDGEYVISNAVYGLSNEVLAEISGKISFYVAK